MYKVKISVEGALWCGITEINTEQQNPRRSSYKKVKKPLCHWLVRRIGFKTYKTQVWFGIGFPQGAQICFLNFFHEECLGFCCSVLISVTFLSTWTSRQTQLLTCSEGMYTELHGVGSAIHVVVECQVQTARGGC